MLLLAAVVAVVSGAEPLHFAALDFTGSGVSPDRVAYLGEYFAAKLAEQDNVRIVTRKDFEAVLGAERQRQLLGCVGDGADCTAEIAAAVNADVLVRGQVAKVGSSFQVNVKLISGRTGQPLFVYTSELLRREEDILVALSEVAPKAVRGVSGQRDGSSAGSVHWPRLLPAVAGVVGVAVGAFELSVASQRYGQLTDPASRTTLPQSAAQTDETDGQQSLGLGLAFGIAGVAALAAGLLWFWLGEP
jgi:hypothetical protein